MVLAHNTSQEDPTMDAAVRFPTSPAAQKAMPPALSKRMNVEQAFEVIVRSCIDQIQGNEAGVARYRDAESLHQMRIGLRRFDAAFTLFGELLPAPPALAAELEWLMDQLGPARDWDVFIAATLPRAVGAMPGGAGLERLRAAALERAEALYAQASGAVASARFGKLISALEHWVEQRGWRDDLTARTRMRLKQRVSDFAAAVLEREQQRLLKRGRKLKESGPQARHRVRIAAKRVRYAAEFFAALYPGKRVRPYVQALTLLQDELGWLNDAAVAGRLLDELADDPAGPPEGTALVRGYLAGCTEQGGPAVRRRLKIFAKMPAPR
jgi:CHAD domain-containing protein